MNGEFWNDLVNWLEEDKFLVGCSYQDANGKEQDTGMGIMSGHAYSILEGHQINHNGRTIKLIKIRNPWGLFFYFFIFLFLFYLYFLNFFIFIFLFLYFFIFIVLFLFFYFLFFVKETMSGEVKKKKL